MQKLKEAAERYSAQVHAFVLMTNHVHLLMTPRDKGGISRLMQSLGRNYVRYVNLTYQRMGALWEGRFKFSLVGGRIKGAEPLDSTILYIKEALVKRLYFGAILLLSAGASAEIVTCNSVEILHVVTGAQYGTMIKVSNSSCGGRGGYVCLDPEGEILSQSVSDRVYSSALAYHLAGKKVNVLIDTDKSASACNGSYPVIYDLRNSE